jgi:N-methylhydantoinase B
MRKTIVASTSVAAIPDPAPLDPVTYEVLKHKLWAIVEEQAIALKSVSGSSVVTEANDFNVGLYTPEGDAVAVGRFMFTQARTTGSVIRAIVRDYAENPGIRPGDMFICNDPWMGALHPPDVSIAAPIFVGGELVAWAGCCAHQLDMGGMDFGSWCPEATERQQEAMILSGIKFVEGGEIRQDIWKSIMSMSRLPFLVGLDLRAMTAANTVGTRRLTALMERYGLPTVQAVVQKLLDSSERRMRDRLAELQDGVYRSVDYIDHDGHEDRLYRVSLTVTKSGDTLDLDFTGSSPQAPGFINCTESGLQAGVCAGLIPILAYDVPFNEGLMRPISAHAPSGTICNAESPAPSGMASVAAIYAVTSVVVSALSQLVYAHPDHQSEAQARTCGSFVVINLAGRDRSGEPFGTMLLDGLAGGGGAFSHQDGLQTCGAFAVLEPNIANVETIESFAPIQYLYRKLVTDSGGAGRRRGGVALGWAITPHGVDGLEAIVISHGVNVPNATGFSGGLPGGCTTNLLARGTELELLRRVGHPPLRIQDVGGELVDLGSKPGRFLMKPGDVLDAVSQGGGGWGDPLLRDAEAVRRDVTDGLVTPETAATLYGVVPDEPPDKSDARRSAIRARRLGRPMAPAPRSADQKRPYRWRLGDQLFVLANGQVACACGYRFGSAARNWKSHAVRKSFEPGSIPRLKVRDELELRFYLCPGCGIQHSVELAERDSPPRADAASL